MDIENRLENLKTVDIIIPTHRDKLRRALLNSNNFRYKKKRSFIILPLLKFVLYSIPLVVMFTIGIFIGINISKPKVELFGDLNSLVVKAEKELNKDLDENKNFYHIISRITDKQEAPYEYEITYYEELWENTKNYDYWIVQTDEKNKKIDEKKDIDGKSYSCEECEGIYGLKYEQTKNQDYRYSYDDYYTTFEELDSQGKLTSYNSRASSLLDDLGSAQTKVKRQEKLKELSSIDDVEFYNNYSWKGKTVYAVGYSWSYLNLLSEERFAFFDIETLDYLGYVKKEIVNGEINTNIEIEVLKEEFSDDPFDTNTDGLTLDYDTSDREKGGQLDVYTSDVREETSFYDEYYDSFDEFYNAWDRFRHEKVSISFKKPLYWDIKLIEKTDYKGVYEFKSGSAGLYFRVEENNESLDINLVGENLGIVTINNNIEAKLILESVTEEDPNNYYDITQFQILETVFQYDSKTYVISKLVNPEDDFEKDKLVFTKILESIQFE